MRIKNISTNKIVTIDERINFNQYKLKLKLNPGQAVYLDDHLAIESKQLYLEQEKGTLTLINTSAEVTFAGEAGTPGAGDQGVLTITPDSDTGYSASVPIRAVIIATTDPVYVKVTNQGSSTFDLELFDASGAAYLNAATVKYNFGTTNETSF